jgi:hypothetical protein
VVIGLTILRRPEDVDAVYSHGPARIVPAVAGPSAPLVQDSVQKQPDVTVLLRVKGSAAPSATALFRTQLNFALFPDQEWHWAIVRAKGVPPQIPPDATTMQLVLGAGQLPLAPPPDAGVPVAPPISSSSNLSSSNPNATVH